MDLTWQKFLFSFEGRVNRQWFWIVWGATIILSTVFYLINDFLWIIVALALVWTSLAIGCKRLHDMGYSGWFQLIGLIPFVGGLILLIWLGFIAGNPGENRFGPPPMNEAPSSWS